MSFNPLNSTKNFINQSANSISNSYDKVSSDVFNIISPIVKSVKPNILSEHQNKNAKRTKHDIHNDDMKQKLTNHNKKIESKFESQFVGCYVDDPSNPSMEVLLGPVSNVSECIDIGKKNNFTYVGIRGGNECYASNNIPQTQMVDRNTYCNVGCDDIGAGNCGGFFYNQVYRTSIPDNMNHSLKSEENITQKITNNTTNILENFISYDNDLKKISMGLNIDNFNHLKPINMYVIFFWLIVILLVIYLLFEYLQKK